MSVLLRHAVGAKAHNLSKALTLAGHLHGLHHGRGITEAQGETDIGLRDGAHFKEFHGAGHGGTHGDGVDAVLVA